MVNKRLIRDRARRDLHAEASVPALYIFASETPIPVTVRVLKKSAMIGDLQNGGFAERAEETIRIVFLREELGATSLQRLGRVSVAAGEAYRIEKTDPVDGITQSVDVVQLSATQAADLPLPEGA